MVFQGDISIEERNHLEQGVKIGIIKALYAKQLMTQAQFTRMINLQRGRSCRADADAIERQ